MTRFFHWLRSLLHRSSVEYLDVYQPKERLIYRYFDGQKTVVADPLLLYRKVMGIGPELSVDLKVSQSSSKDAQKAHENAQMKIREVFGVLPLADGGLSELETMDLLDHFLAYCDRIKKNSSPSPTSPVETSAPSERSCEEDPRTSNSLDSGSTDAGSSISTPEPSPTAAV